MGRLIDDITEFLADNGIRCSRQMRHGFDVICAEVSEEQPYRIILPLEVSAKSLEEAVSQSSNASEAIFHLKDSGYPLIITEDRWKSQRRMMESRLLAHLEIFTSIFARNCEIRKIEKAGAQAFLAENHSYGYAACRYHYGLINKKDGSLIAVATFSNARKWIKDSKEIRSYEWTRYASLPGMRISGGMGKLLKAFINEIHPDDIMSYADLEWSEGQVYKSLGFTEESVKAPVSFTIDPATYERKAIRNNIPDAPSYSLFFMNFGSAKYRMKLTDYNP